MAADTTATCTTVALRRTSGRTADRAYVAYISDGTLTVKSAMLTPPINQISWTVVETIANCIGCAIEFNGSFVKSGINKVEYLTDEPWLFHVTSDGQLMAGVLGGSYESLGWCECHGSDAVRGVASKYKDIDQGLLVFYVIAGDLYYRDLIDGSMG